MLTEPFHALRLLKRRQALEYAVETRVEFLELLTGSVAQVIDLCFHSILIVLDATDRHHYPDSSAGQ